MFLHKLSAFKKVSVKGIKQVNPRPSGRRFIIFFPVVTMFLGWLPIINGF